MSTYEQDRLQETLENLDKAKVAGRKLAVDPASQTLRVVGPDDSDGEELNYPLESRIWSGDRSSVPVITLPEDLLAPADKRRESIQVPFRRQDGGEAYSALNTEAADSAPVGSICFLAQGSEAAVTDVGGSEDSVRVLVWFSRNDQQVERRMEGYIRNNGEWTEARLEVVPLRTEVFSRTRGLFETDILRAARVLIVGLGSIGSAIADALGCIGIMWLLLIDDDRLEAANVIRHVAGLSHVGRYKTKATAHVVHEKNPFAQVITCEKKVSWNTEEELRAAVRRCDIVVCAAYDGTVEAVCNKFCVEENKPAVFPGAWRRAYGGEVFQYKPGVGPCYHCLMRNLPGRVREREVAGEGQARRLSYTDRTIEAEPGLKNDIAPLVQMSVKLIMQRLLRGRETALRSLDEDLVAPYFLWLNRRETGTAYERVGPLEYNLDGLRVQRWYGVDLKRDPECVVCGDFMNRVIEREGLCLTDEDAAAFAEPEEA